MHVHSYATLSSDWTIAVTMTNIFGKMGMPGKDSTNPFCCSYELSLHCSDAWCPLRQHHLMLHCRWCQPYEQKAKQVVKEFWRHIVPLLTTEWFFCCIHLSRDSQWFSIGQTIYKNCPSPWRDLYSTPPNIWAHMSQPLKWHPDRFSCFRRAHKQQQATQTMLRCL